MINGRKGGVEETSPQEKIDMDRPGYAEHKVNPLSTVRRLFRFKEVCQTISPPSSMLPTPTKSVFIRVSGKVLVAWKSRGRAAHVFHSALASLPNCMPCTVLLRVASCFAATE